MEGYNRLHVEEMKKIEMSYLWMSCDNHRSL